MNRHSWAERFDCAHIRPLIICRGPVRKETIDVMAELGIESCGILLSDKDSINYERACAPELRDPSLHLEVHAVSDYTGVDAAQRAERIEQIINICKEHNYDSVFAGYGFMAEDIALVSALEKANLRFIGPNSGVVYAAGFKDEAKRIATETKISVTPGVDQLSALALVRKHPDNKSLQALAKKHKLSISTKSQDLLLIAEGLLVAAREAAVAVLSIDDLCAEAVLQVKSLFEDDPKNRLRLKAVGGGGGKGQRIIAAPASYSGNKGQQIKTALEPVPGMVRDVLSETKATGVRDNRNILIERNVENTRHQEIQMVGNGEWFITMGGRDCSLQMHEQKLLEFSVTDEALTEAIAKARRNSQPQSVKTLEAEKKILQRMEEEANRFAGAVGLNSVSTFECIVSGSQHYFMEVNTRIQVEHRVSELCYTLRFTNPDDSNDYFDVHSLVHLMILLAVHSKDLPKPERIPSVPASVEARLNATNDALLPHAGGLVEYWSPPSAEEIRDDQGISRLNPDTGTFLPYRLAGAYDSNIALLLTTGGDRRESMLTLAETLRQSTITGSDLATNLEFHRGLAHWLLGSNAEARPSTAFVGCYLAQVANLYRAAQQLDVRLFWQRMCERIDNSADLDVLNAKLTLLLRPLELLFANPHLLSGWVGYYRNASKEDSWQLLSDLYRYLSLTDMDNEAAHRIWESDEDILLDGEGFYTALYAKLGAKNYKDMATQLKQKKAPRGISAKLWDKARASHRGFQLGNEILLLPFAIAEDVRFYDMGIDDNLMERIPSKLKDKQVQAKASNVLVPPPVHGSNEIVAESGGMFYRREMPDLPPLIEEGQSFTKGDPVCIVEVMKMFNKIHAPCAGTIEKVLVEQDGTVVQKGQPLFKIKPLDSGKADSKDNDENNRRRYTEKIFKRIYS